MVVRIEEESPTRLCFRAQPARWAVALVLGIGITGAVGCLLVERSFAAWACAGFFLFVTLGLSFGAWSRCCLDREAGQITIERPAWTSPRHEQYWFAEVDRFAIRQRYYPPDDPYSDDGCPEELQPERTMLVLALILKNGREVTIAERMVSGQPGLDLVRRLEAFRKSAGTGSSNPVPPGGKVCCICGQDCASRPRLKDPSGRYYHPECHARAAGQVAH